MRPMSKPLSSPKETKAALPGRHGLGGKRNADAHVRIRIRTVDAEVVVLAAELDAERRVEGCVGLRGPDAARIDAELERAARDGDEESLAAMLLRHPRKREAQRTFDLDRITL